MEFVKFNINPKNKKTGDCVIRAVATALNMSWEATYKEMFEIAMETGYAISCKENYKELLKRHGLQMQQMPRRKDNTRYTVAEFADEIATNNRNYILNLASHLTCLKGKTLYDLWNCGKKSVGNYWMIDKKEVKN